jgi:hypothetical protein
MEAESEVGFSAEPRLGKHGFAVSGSLGGESGRATGELRCRWDYSPQNPDGAFMECRIHAGRLEVSFGLKLRAGEGWLRGQAGFSPTGAESRVRWETSSD